MSNFKRGRSSREAPERVDVAVIFGTGFAPYTGGPMNYSNGGEQ
jgi:hypothetical protein